MLSSSLVGRAVLDVIRLGVPEVGEDQLIDRGGRFSPPRTGCRQQVPGVEPPLGDQAGVFLVALGGAVGAEVVVLAVDGDDGGIARLVEAVCGRAVGFGHGGGSEAGQNGTCTVFPGPLCRAPTAGGYA